MVGEITSLAHELGDDTVETGSGEPESRLSGTELTEILSSLGYNIGTELHDDASSGLSANGDIEVNRRKRPAEGKDGLMLDCFIHSSCTLEVLVITLLVRHCAL